MRKMILMNIIMFLALIAIAGGLYYYFYEQETFITTDDAQVSGQLVTITPQIPGVLMKWSIKNGDKVTAGGTIGEQNNAAAIASYHATHPEDKTVPTAVQNEGLITSPINGTIVQTGPYVEGQAVAPGMPLAYVVDMSHLNIVANVEETNLQDVKIGNSVDIYLDSDPGTKYSGYVSSIGDMTAGMSSLLPTNNGSGNYTKQVQRVPVTITFSSGVPANMKPGMNATVKIHR